MPVDVSPEDFNALLDSWAPTKAAAAPKDDLTGLAPATKEALITANADVMKNTDTSSWMGEEMKAAGLRPGVPFNPERGASLRTRAALSFDSNTLNQFKLLANIYGSENVDAAKNGMFVIRDQLNPETGRKEDFHVNPMGVDAGDVAGMTADVPTMVAGAMGAKLGGQPFTGKAAKVAGSLTGMAIGTELTAGVEEAAARFLQDNKIEPGSIAGERARQAVVDASLGALAVGGAKVASKAFAGALGLAGIEAASTPATEAAKELAKSTGVKYPLTPGEASNSEILLRMEAIAKPRFGSAGLFGKVEAAKKSAEDELRRVFLGLPRTMSDDAVVAALPKADVTGQKVLGRLGTEALQLEGGVEKAAQNVQKIGTAEAQRVAGVNLANPIEPTTLGGALRSKAVSDFEKFKTDFGTRYNNFFSKPETSQRTILGDDLAKAAQKVENTLTPAAEVTKVVPTGLVDMYGNPSMTMTTETERLNAFVKGTFKSKVDELKGLTGAKVSVNDLKQIRTEIDDAIAEGVSIPGVNVKQLTSLKKVVSDEIDTALKAMPDKTLYPEWQKLNQDYASSRSKFDKVGIREMLIKEGESGSIGNAELARSVASGGPGSLDRYNSFKQFFGPASPEFRAMQQTARESLLRGSLEGATDFVSGSRLRADLRSIDPEVAADLFGTSKQELHRISEALTVAQGNIDLNTLNKMASSKTLTAAAIPELLAAEQARATAWGNKLIRAAAKGSVDAEKIVPSEVVRNLTSMDPDAATKVLGVLHDRPELIQEVKQLAFENLWGSLQSNLKGVGRISSPQIEKALGEDVQARTWKLLLGNDVVDNIQQLAKVIKPQEFSTKVFKTVGSMGATTDTVRLEHGGVGQIAMEAATRILLGTIYTGPMKQVVVNLAGKQDISRLLNAVVASTPFIEKVTERFGSDSPEIMKALRTIVEPQQSRSLQLQGKVNGGPIKSADQLSPEEFDQWLKNAAQ